MNEYKTLQYKCQTVPNSAKQCQTYILKYHTPSHQFNKNQ